MKTPFDFLVWLANWFALLTRMFNVNAVEFCLSYFDLVWPLQNWPYHLSLYNLIFPHLCLCLSFCLLSSFSCKSPSLRPLKICDFRLQFDLDLSAVCVNLPVLWEVRPLQTSHVPPEACRMVFVCLLLTNTGCLLLGISSAAVLSSYGAREYATTADPYLGHSIGPVPGYGVSSVPLTLFGKFDKIKKNIYLFQLVCIVV